MLRVSKRGGWVWLACRRQSSGDVGHGWDWRDDRAPCDSGAPTERARSLGDTLGPAHLAVGGCGRRAGPCTGNPGVL